MRLVVPVGLGRLAAAVASLVALGSLAGMVFLAGVASVVAFGGFVALGFLGIGTLGFRLSARISGRLPPVVTVCMFLLVLFA